MTINVTIQLMDLNVIGIAASVIGAIFGAGCFVVNYLMYRKMK